MLLYIGFDEALTFYPFSPIRSFLSDVCSTWFCPYCGGSLLVLDSLLTTLGKPQFGLSVFILTLIFVLFNDAALNWVWWSFTCLSFASEIVCHAGICSIYFDFAYPTKTLSISCFGWPANYGMTAWMVVFILALIMSCAVSFCIILFSFFLMSTLLFMTIFNFIAYHWFLLVFFEFLISLLLSGEKLLFNFKF